MRHLSPSVQTARGQRGLCFVRQEEVRRSNSPPTDAQAASALTRWKKPLNHFLPGTPILSFGTAGCNLGCRFCQNWDISKSREFDRLTDSASPQAIAEAASLMAAAVSHSPTTTPSFPRVRSGHCQGMPGKRSPFGGSHRGLRDAGSTA